MRRRAAVAAMLWAGFLCASVAAQEKGPETREQEVYELLVEGSKLAGKGAYLEAVEVYHKAIGLAPDDPMPRTCLGMVCLSIWRYDQARHHLEKALALDPDSVGARVWLARCDLREFEYVRALERLREALDLKPEDPDAMAVLTLLLIHLDDLDRAEDLAQKTLAVDASHGFARVCLAHIHLLRKRGETAAREFAQCIRENRYNAAAYVGLGQTLSNLGRPVNALQVLNEGVRRNPFLPQMFSTRAFVRFKMKRVDDAIRDYRKSLEIDEDYAGGHGIYSFYDASERESRRPSGPAGSYLREALEAMRTGDPVEGAWKARLAAESDPSSLLALLVQGAAAHALEDYDTMLECARRALALDPKAPLAHVLFLEGMDMKQEVKKLELSREDFYTRFQALPAPPVQGIEGVFPNYASLTPDAKKVVRRAAGPFAHLLGDLAEEGVAHFILPLYMHLTDVEAMKPWKAHRTFDGRSYDAVRGAAGKVAVSGVETLWPATRMGPSTIAHEFAHQVHQYGLSGSEKSEITMLYRRAKERGRFLDYYAGENEMEYFAQGYEAFVSPFKRPTSSETAKNTRDDLEKTDPDLFHFLLRITEGEAAPDKR